MSASGDVRASIALSANPENQRYRALFPVDISDDIFVFGETISGTVHIELANASKLRHKGMTAKIVRQISGANSALSETASLVLQLEKDGQIDREFKADFAFPKVEMLGETYVGGCSVTFAVIVTVLRSIVSDLVFVKRFAYVRPRERPKGVIPISLPIKGRQGLDIRLLLQKAAFATNEHIEGSIIVGSASPGSLAKACVQLVCVETLRAGSQTRINERVVCNYELIDGTPNASFEAPFVLQLGPLHLWAAGPSDSALHVSYKIEFVAHMKSGAKVVASSPIEIFLLACD